MLNETASLFATVAAALLFYVVIPGGGAFLVRARWRRFRRDVQSAWKAHTLDYADHAGSIGGTAVAFSGTLEALEEEGGFWIGDGRLSVLVRLRHVPVYLMPPAGQSDDNEPDSSPRALYWKNLSALAEGTRVLVYGRVQESTGTFVFGAQPEDRPLVMLHDGRTEQLIRRAVWAGRQRNEFWNHLTPVSLLAGMVAQTLLAVTVVEVEPLVAVVAFVLALLPVLPLFPPGVLAFYWYRRLWRTGRRIRAQRDVRAMSRPAPRLSRLALRWEAAAMVCFLAGLTVNAYLTATLVAVLLA